MVRPLYHFILLRQVSHKAKHDWIHVYVGQNDIPTIIWSNFTHILIFDVKVLCACSTITRCVISSEPKKHCFAKFGKVHFAKQRRTKFSHLRARRFVSRLFWTIFFVKFVVFHHIYAQFPSVVSFVFMFWYIFVTIRYIILHRRILFVTVLHSFF